MKLNRMWVLVFALLSISGCGKSMDRMDAPTETKAAVLTTDAIHTTGLPSKTPTLISSRNQTQTPYPTVPAEDALPSLISFIQTQKDCQVPCVWGVIPGETYFEFIRENIFPLGSIEYEEFSPNLWKYWVSIPDLQQVSGDDYIYASFITDHERIIQISIYEDYIKFPHETSWNELMLAFGPPDKIFIAVVDPLYPTTSFEIILIYDSENFLFKIIGATDQSPPEDIIDICPKNDEDLTFLFAWPTTENRDFDELRSYANLRRNYYELGFLIPDMTHQKFYDLFSGENANFECLNIPVP